MAKNLADKFKSILKEEFSIYQSDIASATQKEILANFDFWYAPSKSEAFVLYDLDPDVYLCVSSLPAPLINIS